MIDKETVRKMLENRDCGVVSLCADCLIDNLQKDEFVYYKWFRCCEKNDGGYSTAEDGRKFRPRVIRLLTEWLAEQEKEEESND